MKTLRYLLLFLILLGCKEKDTTNPLQPDEQKSSVNVIFYSGFQSDSVVVKSDSNVVFIGIAKSDSILGFPNGCVFMVTKGLYILSVEIPNENIRSDTQFFSSSEFGVRIHANFKRDIRKITYEIYHIGPG